MEEWVEIVPAMPRKDAQERLREWQEARLAAGDPVDDNQIREDVVHAVGDRTLFRYCIRRP